MDLYKQKYAEALEKLQEALAPTEDGCKISGLTRRCIENIFPELKESEDERIRKMLRAYIHDFGVPKEYFEDVEASDVLAWLEKQGEKLEPNKVIEWLENNQPSVCVVEKFKKDFGL